MPSLCVPELPRSYERLEQLLGERFEVTAIARHPDNGKAHINTIMVGLRRG